MSIAHVRAVGKGNPKKTRVRTSDLGHPVSNPCSSLASSLAARLALHLNFSSFALLNVVAMKQGTLVWLSTTWRRPCIGIGSWIWGRRTWLCSKQCNGSKRGEQFHGGDKAHGLNVGFEGDGQGIDDLGLQWIQERDTISWWQRSPWIGVMGAFAVGVLLLGV